MLPDDSREFIIWLFRGRCVVCHKPGTEVNEIIPRARGKASLDWKNKVLMCHNCHSAFHEHGVNDIAIANLQERRIQFLSEMGREKYVQSQQEEI